MRNAQGGSLGQDAQVDGKTASLEDRFATDELIAGTGSRPLLRLHAVCSGFERTRMIEIGNQPRPCNLRTRGEARFFILRM